MKGLYFDNNAYSQLDPQVIESLQHFFQMELGNPSSVHAYGRRSKEIVETVRRKIARYFGVKAQEILFTSGGTEAINYLVKGFIDSIGPCHVITSKVEHPAVLQTMRYLQTRGCEVTFLETGFWGMPKEDVLAAAIQPNTKLIVLSAANHETGVKLAVEKIADIAQAQKICFIVDAVSWIGKATMFSLKGVSALAFSGQKIHALSGIGGAYIKENVPIKPLLHGGGQEHGKRSGTENLLGIVSLGKAFELIEANLLSYVQSMKRCIDHLGRRLLQEVNPVAINGEGPKISNTLNLSFPKVDAEDLMMLLDQKGLAVSLGSACSSGSIEPSQVLLGMGYSQDRVLSSIRFSINRYTTLEEIDRCVDIVVQEVTQLKALCNKL